MDCVLSCTIILYNVSFNRYGLSWNPNLNGHLLSASDDHVSKRWVYNDSVCFIREMNTRNNVEYFSFLLRF